MFRRLHFAALSHCATPDKLRNRKLNHHSKRGAFVPVSADWVRCLASAGSRKEYYERICWSSGAGFHTERSKPERREALRFRGEEKCRAGFLSARLESHLHQRACLLRQ